jgi:uncharacterized protein
MFHRLLSPLKSNSFFLFGARGTGKSTLLRRLFTDTEAEYIDLLDPVTEDALARNPRELVYRINALPEHKKWVILDEIQKVPRLLDLVHAVIESKDVRFAMTGSSARKLRHGVSNLLAGRAFVNHLYPLTSIETGDRFQLEQALRWGTLPKIYQFTTAQEKEEYLRAYAFAYLKEEIAAEQVVRKLDPFRNFLEIAAQCNGTILNYTRIADDIGVDTKTVQSYFSILEDTLLGITLPAFHGSVRKRQLSHPKFYLFDTGIKRALERTVSQPLTERSYGFGNAFEHFIFLEIYRLNDYHRKDWRFSYLRTKDGAEIDLIIDRPGSARALIEIKSTDHVDERDVATLNKFADDITPSAPYCISRDPRRKKIGKTLCLHWQEAFRELGVDHNSGEQQ